MPRNPLLLLLFIALISVGRADAQLSAQYGFQITFTDKNNTPYSLTAPSAYLSPRAIARRARQGIPIDSTDLPVNAAYVDSVLTLTGGVFHETSKWLNACMILLSDSAQIEALAGQSFISNVKLVGYFNPGLHSRSSLTTSVFPASVSARGTSYDAAYYGNTWPQTQQVTGNFLSDNGYQGQGVLIAVLDAGFTGADTNPGFDSMWNAGNVVDTHDFTYHGSSVFTDDFHGMQVLSTMAGNVPGAYVGTAPDAMYALYITEYNPADEPMELDNMMCAAERADSIGADIITESLGYDIFDYPPGSGQVFDSLDGKTTVAAKAANFATTKGILFVATAGNDGSPPIPGWGTHIMTPGDADSALTIGAVDDLGNAAIFTGYGPNAAGVVKPDVCAMGVDAEIFQNGSGGYAAGNGTSFATPQVAGWAACLLQANPEATPFLLRQTIIRCASSYNDPGQQLGYGIPNFACSYQQLGIKNVVPVSYAFLTATPNPFGNELQITCNPPDDGNVGFVLTTVTGARVASFTQYMYKGYNRPYTLQLPGLPAGMYLLKANAATQQQVIKVVKE